VLIPVKVLCIMGIWIGIYFWLLMHLVERYRKGFTMAWRESSVDCHSIVMGRID
jgi:hypothetical protein